MDQKLFFFKQAMGAATLWRQRRLMRRISAPIAEKTYRGQEKNIPVTGRVAAMLKHHIASVHTAEMDTKHMFMMLSPGSDHMIIGHVAIVVRNRHH